jgi:hypothetical protein
MQHLAMCLSLMLAKKPKDGSNGIQTFSAGLASAQACHSKGLPSLPRPWQKTPTTLREGIPTDLQRAINRSESSSQSPDSARMVCAAPSRVCWGSRSFTLSRTHENAFDKNLPVLSDDCRILSAVRLINGSFVSQNLACLQSSFVEYSRLSGATARSI